MRNRQHVSTTHMLVELIHSWSQAVDHGNHVRIVYLDYTKAFDKINHHILLRKYEQMDIHPLLLKWIAGFLLNRQQSVKIGDIISSPKSMKGAIPQGALMGMEAFCEMIKDLELTLPLYKYVDDSTVYDIVNRNEKSDRLQRAIDQALAWTTDNDMLINHSKTNEMIISFTKCKPEFTPITIEGQEIDSVQSTKLVGVYIQDDLKWDSHVDYIVKKSKSKLYFLTQLKKSGLSSDDLLCFYKCVIRSNLEYAAPVFGTSLPDYLSDNIESVQKRALRIIYPELSYNSAICQSQLNLLKERRRDICKNFFKDIQNKDNILNHLLPSEIESKYDFRRKTKYPLPRCRTNRFKNTLIPYGLFNFQ